MISMKAVVLTFVWMPALVWTGIVGYVVGPGLEERAFPVITDQSAIPVSRTDTQACWSWRYTKARAVTMLSKSFVIERDDGVRYPVEELRPDLGIPSNDSTTARSGVTRTIPECVSIPESMRAARHFIVKGKNIYRPFHGLWALDQPVISVEFGLPF